MRSLLVYFRMSKERHDEGLVNKLNRLRLKMNEKMDSIFISMSNDARRRENEKKRNRAMNEIFKDN